MLNTIFGNVNGLESRTIAIFYTDSAILISGEIKTPTIFFVFNFDVFGDGVGHRSVSTEVIIEQNWTGWEAEWTDFQVSWHLPAL